jgi:hypothetical protein
VVFTASLAKYADPLLDVLDKDKVVQFRLFREACVQHYGNYVKDLTHLGRALESSIIVDNSPFSYMFQSDNAIPITSWFDDKSDRQVQHLDSLLSAVWCLLSAVCCMLSALCCLLSNNGVTTLLPFLSCTICCPSSTRSRKSTTSSACSNARISTSSPTQPRPPLYRPPKVLCHAV